MTRSKIRTSGAEGLTLSSTALTVANGLTLTDGDVTVASGHGVTFAATSDTSATNATMANELFDDYEEGTWTCVIADASSGGNENTPSQTCRYTKIGRMVICQLKVDNINTSGMTGTNDLHFLGMPFSHSDTACVSAVMVNETNIEDPAGDSVPIVFQLSQTFGRLVHIRDNTVNDKIQVQEFESTTADIQTTLVYRTTS